MSYVIAAVGFMLLIVLHELGHFAVAKAVGMRVERFSLFFPPFAWRRQGSGCGGAELECDSLDTRDSVIKIVSADGNNALVNYAAKNSSVIEARVNNASTEAEYSRTSTG